MNRPGGDERHDGGPARSFGALATRLLHPPARLQLAELPTPVERAPWLDAPPIEAWIKRDDRSSPIYGGGKVRKLEWILANPPFDDERAVMSIGGLGSHHLLALALFLQEQGRRLHALTFETALTPHVRRNLAVLVSTGTQFWHVATRARLPLAFASYYAIHRPGEPARYMPPGASTALGCFGFVEAGLELAQQIESGLLPTPRTIFVTAGTAGTAAGLLLGLALAGVSTHLHLVSSVERWAFNELLLRRKLSEALAALRQCGLRAPRSAARWLAEAGVGYHIDHGQVGRGYGEPTPASVEAATVAAEHGIHLETTYTAKCLAALRAAGPHLRGGPVLFWNTHAANDLSARIVPGWEARSPIAERLKLP